MDKMTDVRIYVYQDNSIFEKPHNRMAKHKHKSYSSAVANIEELRANDKYPASQLVLIDYSKSPSRIILINNPDEK